MENLVAVLQQVGGWKLLVIAIVYAVLYKIKLKGKFEVNFGEENESK